MGFRQSFNISGLFAATVAYIASAFGPSTFALPPDLAPLLGGRAEKAVRSRSAGGRAHRRWRHARASGIKGAPRG